MISTMVGSLRVTERKLVAFRNSSKRCSSAVGVRPGEDMEEGGNVEISSRRLGRGWVGWGKALSELVSISLRRSLERGRWTKRQRPPL